MHAETTETVIRTGDSLIRTTVKTTVESLHIDFADILAAAEVSPDDSMGGETPWDWCDGYKHRIRSTLSAVQEKDSRGYCWDTKNRHYIIITMEWDHDLEKWYREHGVSRQVAREKVALSLRKRIDQLTSWYEDGWEWWRCHGEYKGASDSLGGIDSYEYANRECRQDVAMEIASQLESEGYVITNRP